MIALRDVLIATDFSDAADRALAYGRELARTFGATIHVIHVIENSFLRATAVDPEVRKAMAADTLNQRLTDDDRRTLRARTVLNVSDHPADAVVHYARTGKIDLIVVGTRGRGVASQLLVGSVAERIVRMAPCPVLTVRSTQHEFVYPNPSDRVGCRSGIH